jgi:hypothetical protein
VIEQAGSALKNLMLTRRIIMAAKTMGDLWKEKQYKKIDKEAEEKKDELDKKATMANSGSTHNEKEKIDKRAEEKKRDVDEVLKKMDPAKKNKPVPPGYK